MKKITILMMSLLAASSFVFAQTKAGKADTSTTRCLLYLPDAS